MYKIVDTAQNNRIVQTFDTQASAMLAAGRMNEGERRLRFVSLPMAEGDQKRADHVTR